MVSKYNPTPEYNDPKPDLTLYPSPLEIEVAKLVAALGDKRPQSDMLYREWSGQLAVGADTGDTIYLDHAPEWWVIRFDAPSNGANNTLTATQQGTGDTQTYSAGTFEERRVWPGNGNKIKIVNTGIAVINYAVVALRGYDPAKVG